MGSKEGDYYYDWALVQFLMLLVQTHDPRHELIQILADHWSWCLRENGPDGGGGGATKTSLEAVGMHQNALKTIRHEAEKIRRVKNTWYPRARQQANSRNYLKTILGLSAEKCEPIPEDTNFLVLGTCFAQNIHSAFQKHGIHSQHIQTVEEDPAESQFAFLSSNSDLANFIKNTSPCIILTLGFAETKMIDREARRSGRLSKFSTPDHIADLIVEGIRKLRTINPNVRIFITVSPVPLEGTASTFNVFEANAISKSIVRYAVALAGEQEPSFTYFPSYEIVTQIAPSVGISSFGQDDGHPRHVDARLVDFICSLFLETYCPWAK